MESYLVPAGDGEAEFTEKHSRFIGRVRRTDTEGEALEMLRELREAHRDATHNVFAYRIRENNLTRYSDDGEPSGTSGLPTLGVFTGAEVKNVCCVVTRYFGGTLLGTGGLVRAYTKAAQLALEAAGIAEMALWTRFTLALPYPFYERAQRLFARVAQPRDRAGQRAAFAGHRGGAACATRDRRPGRARACRMGAAAA